MRLGRLVVLIALLAGCRSRGTVAVSLALDGDLGCTWSNAVVLLVPGDVCASCTCHDCLSTCARTSCVSGCPSGECSAAELDSAVSIDPPNAGAFSLVVELLRDDGTIAASACQPIDVDANGTASRQENAAVQCCSGS